MEPQPNKTNRITKGILFSLGVLSVALGVIGLFLPLLPTTPFVLLAAWCFVKSSPKAHQWLQRQPGLGPALRDWEQSRSIRRKTKVTAILLILISLGFMWCKVQILGLKIGVTLLLVAVSTFIITRPEAKK